MATEIDPQIKMRFDLTVEEAKVLNSMENWATTLFVTAIALATKQLVDWSNAPSPSGQVVVIPLTYVAYLFPAGIGLVAFLMLRIINFRIREVRHRQRKLVDSAAMAGSLGLVGWSMAAMPLLFGFACSAYFIDTRPAGITPFSILLVVGVLAFAVAVNLFRKQSREHVKGEA